MKKDVKKIEYVKPQFKYMGEVSNLTKSGGAGDADAAWTKFTPSVS